MLRGDLLLMSNVKLQYVRLVHTTESMFEILTVTGRLLGIWYWQF